MLTIYPIHHLSFRIVKTALLLCIFSSLQLYAQKGMKPVQGISPAGTERRLALVIGNKDYQYVSRLNNPLNDAEDMASALSSLGFEVILRTNLTEKDLTRTIDEFGNRLRQYDVGLFYYSGHGVQHGGENYLVPVDAQVKVSSEIEYTCVKLGRTMAKMEGANLKVSLAFIDACRDSPFPATTKSTLAKGLSIPNNPPGSFVAFSTRAGSTADDNQEGRNGLFTSELLRHLTVPNLGVRDILDRTTQGVSARSNRNQIPGRYDELTGDFKFVITGSAAVSSATSAEVVEKPMGEKVVTSTVTTAQTAKFMDFPFADMVYVSGGSFTMGDARELGDADAKPAHSVNVTSFWMGKYEITQAQWKAIVGTNPSTFKNCDNCPVENVSWLDAVAFCNKLSEKEGKQRVYTISGNEVKIDVFANGYRLPTEAEWEYAAGGGIASRTLYGNGQDLLRSSEANYYGNRTQDGVYKAKPVTVGSYRANDLGLYDMTGNVWEWCQDWYGNYTTGAQTNPQGAKSGSSRVFRGGSWFSSPAFGAVNMRGSNGPSYRDNQLGFRVVCAP